MWARLLFPTKLLSLRLKAQQSETVWWLWWVSEPVLALVVGAVALRPVEMSQYWVMPKHRRNLHLNCQAEFLSAVPNPKKIAPLKKSIFSDLSGKKLNTFLIYDQEKNTPTNPTCNWTHGISTMLEFTIGHTYILKGPIKAMLLSRTVQVVSP